MNKYNCTSLNKEQYKRLEKEINTKLEGKCLIPSYTSDKKTFKSLDLVVCLDYIKIIRILNPLYVTINENIITLIYPFEDIYFQINLIKKSLMDYKCCNFFKSFENIGVIFNEIFNNFGFSLEEEGLFYIDKDSDFIISKEKVTSCPANIIHTLGIDYMFYYNFFRNTVECDITLEEIFNFICSSCIFDPYHWSKIYFERKDLPYDPKDIYNKFLYEYLPNRFDMENLESKDETFKLDFSNKILKDYELSEIIKEKRFLYEFKTKLNKCLLEVYNKNNNIMVKDDFKNFVNFCSKNLNLTCDLNDLEIKVKILYKKYEESQFDLI